MIIFFNERHVSIDKPIYHNLELVLSVPSNSSRPAARVVILTTYDVCVLAFLTRCADDWNAAKKH